MNPRRRRTRKGCQPYEPSPSDIRRACEDIQAKWSERERKKRSGRPPDGWWLPPSVNLSNIDEAVREDLGNSLPANGSPAHEWDR
jgi:hypothetical protein